MGILQLEMLLVAGLCAFLFDAYCRGVLSQFGNPELIGLAQKLKANRIVHKFAISDDGVQVGFFTLLHRIFPLT